MSLYSLNEAIASFEPQVDEETGELLNAAELEQLTLARDEKIENICKYIKNLTAERDAIWNETVLLRQRADKLERKADGMKRYLAMCLNGEKFKSPTCEVTYTTGESLETTPDFMKWAAENRDDLLRYSAPNPDATAIKAALKAGEKLEGARIVKNTYLKVK